MSCRLPTGVGTINNIYDLQICDLAIYLRLSFIDDLSLSRFHREDAPRQSFNRQSPESPVEGNEELLVAVTLCVPTETTDITDSLVQRVEFVQFRQGTLHEFGILTE